VAGRNYAIEYVDPRKHQSRIKEAVESRSQLLNRLDELEKQYSEWLDAPIGVNLTNGCGETLDIGLGGEKWSLGYSQFEDGVPIEQLNAVGDETASGSTPFYFEQWTEMPNKWLIPRETAKEAIGKWYESGELETQIDWTEESY